MPAPHPPEFGAGRVELAQLREKPVAEIAKDLGISESCLRNWMARSDIDAGRKGCPRRSAVSWSGFTGRTVSRRV